jgi:hypothetical protein
MRTEHDQLDPMFTLAWLWGLTRRSLDLVLLDLDTWPTSWRSPWRARSDSLAARAVAVRPP